MCVPDSLLVVVGEGKKDVDELAALEVTVEVGGFGEDEVLVEGDITAVGLEVTTATGVDVVEVVTNSS